MSKFLIWMMMGLYHELIGKSLIGINWTNNGTTGWILPFSQIGLIGIEWKSMRLIRSTELDRIGHPRWWQFPTAFNFWAILWDKQALFLIPWWMMLCFGNFSWAQWFLISCIELKYWWIEFKCEFLIGNTIPYIFCSRDYHWPFLKCIPKSCSCFQQGLIRLFHQNKNEWFSKVCSWMADWTMKRKCWQGGRRLTFR